MAIATSPPKANSPVLGYASLLRQVHDLIRQGKGDTDEAEALAASMDVPWYAMTPEEQVRMRGLSVDLYSLREGGSKQEEMPPQQFVRWRNEAKRVFSAVADRGTSVDLDAALNFLRQPAPRKLPKPIIPFLQSRCWEKLGDLETALEFMMEAERHDPDQTLSVLTLLQALDRGLQPHADHFAGRTRSAGPEPESSSRGPSPASA